MEYTKILELIKEYNSLQLHIKSILVSNNYVSIVSTYESKILNYGIVNAHLWKYNTKNKEWYTHKDNYIKRIY